MIRYTTISRPNASFICANSGFGFVSYFEELFAPCERLYIIKGGPGTGKSSFMEKAARRAEAQGLLVERICCSSDPYSLDGVLIPQRALGITDGTAPHVCEPTLPGAREQLIDPGQFWDGARLHAQKQEILALNTQKRALYASALSLIEGAKNAALCRHGLLASHINEEKKERLLRKLSKKANAPAGTAQTRLISSLGMKGALQLDTYTRQAKEIYTILPYYGTELLLLEALLKKLKEEQRTLIFCPDPVTLLPEALFFEHSKVLIRCGTPLGSGAEQKIHTKKLLSPALEASCILRSLQKQEEGLLESALILLKNMQDCHFALEKIYQGAMDFDAFEQYQAVLLEKMLPQ